MTMSDHVETPKRPEGTSDEEWMVVCTTFGYRYEPAKSTDNQCD